MSFVCSLEKGFVSFFLKSRRHFQSSFRFIVESRAKYRDFLYTPYPYTNIASCITTCPTRCGTFITVDEPVSVHHNHLKSTVYIGAHFWCCTYHQSVQSLSHVQLFVTPWTATRQASLSITNSQNLLELMSIESVMPSNHLILCHPLLLPPSIFPSIRVFSNESVFLLREDFF